MTVQKMTEKLEFSKEIGHNKPVEREGSIGPRLQDPRWIEIQNFLRKWHSNINKEQSYVRNL